MATTANKWRIAPLPPPAEIAKYTSGGLSRLTAVSLINRKVSPADIQAFTESSLAQLPDPFMIQNMEVAAKHFAHAIKNRIKCAVWLDYDVDGITSGAVIYRFAQTAGLQIGACVPHRVDDGYGLNIEGLQRLADQGTKYVITVDCGISNIQEAQAAKDMGLKLIITDHHQPGETLPDAVAVVNPHILSSAYPYRPLAGVGVAFQLVIATRKILREQGWFNFKRPEPDIASLLPLVALGTICDMVPVTGVNRIMTAQGIKRIRESKHRILGLNALCIAAGISVDEISSGSIGFQLGPRCNASGRLTTAETAFRLLTTDDHKEATELAEELNQLNVDRRALEEKLTALAVSMVEGDSKLDHRKTIVLASEDFEPSVQGIIASRIVQQFAKPTVIISLDGPAGKGSCRSIPAFNMHEALISCSDHLEKFGGHPMAAGLSIATDKVAAFMTAFEKIAEGWLTEDDLQHQIIIDAEIALKEVTLKECDDLTALEPFGEQNRKPLFCIRGCKVVSSKVLKGKHLKLSLGGPGTKATVDAIAFGNTGEGVGELVDVVVSLEVNEWNGRRTPQLMIKDMRNKEE